MLKTILQPDSSTKMLRLYHWGGVPLLSLTGLSLGLRYTDTTVSHPVIPVVDTLCVANIGFHSYVSMATVITDYVKPRPLALVARTASVTGHLAATVGLIGYAWQHTLNQNNQEDI